VFIRATLGKQASLRKGFFFSLKKKERKKGSGHLFSSSSSFGLASARKFPIEPPLQYGHKTSTTSKIYRCNIGQYVRKLIKLFDSRIRKFPPQHEHHVSCNIHYETCGNNSSNIEHQPVKYTFPLLFFCCRQLLQSGIRLVNLWALPSPCCGNKSISSSSSPTQRRGTSISNLSASLGDDAKGGGVRGAARPLAVLLRLVGHFQGPCPILDSTFAID